MSVGKHTRFSSHTFHDLESARFDPKQYSKLKFGSDLAAKKMGHELAVDFFHAHADAILANRCVVIPSPYNFVKNAATLMTLHFINKMNELSVIARGEQLEYSIIHRKVSYTNDYGFLSKEKRKGLIDNDSFYLNRDFLDGKTLIFIDDVIISGTHEEKLKEILIRDNVENDSFFLYYAAYNGNSPQIEGALNFAAIKSLDDYVALTKEPNHQVIIRPIKYLLGQPTDVLKNALLQFSDDFVEQTYFGCFAEGYHKIPHFQPQFGLIVAEYNRRAVK